MKLSEGVEWAAHCVTLLGALPKGARLSGHALAEFHGVPESYLLKHLKSLVSAGILMSVPGPQGGYGIAREPAEISLFDIVVAVDGPKPAFRCMDIRRRGPCSLDDSAYPKPCGINRAMARAETAYRAALREEKISDLIAEFGLTADPRIVALGQKWIVENIRVSKG